MIAAAFCLELTGEELVGVLAVEGVGEEEHPWPVEVDLEPKVHTGEVNDFGCTTVTHSCTMYTLGF